jgi:hypothetical protein
MHASIQNTISSDPFLVDLIDRFLQDRFLSAILTPQVRVSRLA